MADEKGTRAWTLNATLVNVPGGGIVHAYPDAKFLRVWRRSTGDAVVSFLDRVPDGISIAKPNEHEIEYCIRMFGIDEQIPEEIGNVVDCFQCDDQVFVAFVKKV